MHTRSQTRNLHNQQQQAPPAVVEPFNLEDPFENHPLIPHLNGDQIRHHGSIARSTHESKVRNSRNKPVVAKVSASTSGISSEVAELKEMVKLYSLTRKLSSPRSYSCLKRLEPKFVYLRCAHLLPNLVQPLLAML
ncbi:hypothetical protein Tco_0424803 [Tanacetum coccineum]